MVTLNQYLVLSAVLFAIGAAGVFVRRNLITIARPTAASAAATVITKNTMIWPSAEPSARPKATNVRLTAFSRKPRNGRSGMRISMSSGPRRHKDTKTNTKKNDLLCVLVSSWSRHGSSSVIRVSR